MTKQDIQQILESNPNKRDLLFCRGYYFSNTYFDESNYPFYNLWKHELIKEKFHLYVSPKQHFVIHEQNNVVYLLIGHAYDPVDREWDDKKILKCMAEAKTESLFWERLNNLTGIFTLIIVKEESVILIGDATCMQNAFYTYMNEKIYISSHTNLLGDILNLKKDEYISELSKYKFFKLLGNSLPGDLTQFKTVKRLVPNHFVQFTDGKIIIKRFYWPHVCAKTVDQIVDNVSALMHENMRLISLKFKKPAISLTGGVDSKTTLACTNGLYRHFKYFSYSSNPDEEVDANAARTICKELGLKHILYHIPNEDTAYPDIELTRALLLWNTGDLCANNPNDVRKRRYFEEITDFDIEVKSWASEIGRAYFSKRFNGRTNFGRITARKCTTMYKFFLHNRNLVRKTDIIFQYYLNHYFEQAKENPIDWQEQFFWEFRVPSWNGLVITGEHRYSFDITIPYNNRRILNLLVSAPIQDRINDTVYKRIQNKMNPRISAIGIAVTNVKHTQRRAKLENLYYTIHSHLPF